MLTQTQTHLILHERALAILGMIERCEILKRISWAYLVNNQYAPWFYITKKIYEKDYNRAVEIRKRLLVYYANVLQKIVEPAISNAKVIGDFKVTENGSAELIQNHFTPVA